MKRLGARQIWFHAMTVVLVVVSFAAGNVTGFLARPAFAADGEPTEFAVFWEAWNLVLENFVDREKINYSAMTYGAIQGMLDSLGDQNHTVFFSPEQAQQQQSSLEGSFEGIGAYVGQEDGRFVIIAPIHGSPAEAAGILAGDIVLAVNGVDVTGMPEWEVISMVRGPSGSTVVLSVLHPDSDEPVDVSIVRGHINLQSVLWERVPGANVAHLRITQFSSDTSSDLRIALDEIVHESQNEPIHGILLDLRNNPGGYLQECLRVASQFLEEGDVIVHERDAEQRITTYRAVGPGLGRSIPMVVLVNSGTASAGEILAGALQENGRAKVVGTTTVGTGTVLRPFSLSDGSVLRLGVTNWLTPNQNLIKGQGIQPDIPIEQEATVELISDVTLRELTSQQVRTHPDRQFQTALLLLQLHVRSRNQEAQIETASVGQ
jgi:carboxyl-terminal processing protease